jgi:hypothetical protein
LAVLDPTPVTLVVLLIHRTVLTIHAPPFVGIVLFHFGLFLFEVDV